MSDEEHPLDSDKCSYVQNALKEAKHLNGLVHWVYRAIKRPPKEYPKLDFLGQEHLVNCSECLSWLSKQVDETILTRAKRAADFCCIGLYIAVEEAEEFSEKNPGLFKEKVTSYFWRDQELRWSIGKGCSISYCPWCGTKLPSERY